MLYDIYVALMIGETVLRVTDNLAKTLQGTRLTASDGQDMAKSTVKHLNTQKKAMMRFTIQTLHYRKLSVTDTILKKVQEFLANCI